MIPTLVDHLWQSTLFVGAAWLLTLALRRNQAQVRYWVWFTASVKFLIPFSLLVGLGALVPRRAATPPVQAQWVAMVEQISEPPIALPFIPAAAKQANDNYPATALAFLWASGFAAIAICWLVRWRRVHVLRRSAALVDTMEFPVPVLFAPGLIEPGIVGILRPVLLLPKGIVERLDRAQLDAILAHELCHVRRRDNLTASIHMIVQAIFWFHPLVWWLGTRLVDERERACDEEVLRIFGQPKAYAEGILNVCKLYVESRLACVSGVTGSNLKRRIEAIMRNRMVQKLNGGKKLLLAGSGLLAIVVPTALGMLSAPRIRAQSTPTPKFEVASIRPCEAAPPGGRGGTKGGGGGEGLSPGRLNICRNLEYFINASYVQFANGDRTPPVRVAIEGGPAWIKSDRYRINAKADGEPRLEMMQGPMMQALLEDRFKLKTHRETRDVPVYDLTVAKGGHKLQPFKEGSCISLDPENPPARPLPPPGQRRFCGGPLFEGPSKGQTPTIAFYGANLSTVANALGNLLGRPVIDKTGITGLFDLRLEFVLDESTPGLSLTLPLSDDPPGPSIFTAVQQQLGLKLESARGPGEFLVIDHVERPSEN